MGKPVKGKGKGVKGAKPAPKITRPIGGSLIQPSSQFGVFNAGSNSHSRFPAVNTLSKGSEPCRFWPVNDCHKGDSCKFSHSGSMRPKPVSLSTNILYPGAKGKESKGTRNRSRSPKRREGAVVLQQNPLLPSVSRQESKVKFSLSDVRRPGESEKSMAKRLEARKAKYGSNTPVGSEKRFQKSTIIPGIPTKSVKKVINLTTKSPAASGKNQDGTVNKGGVKFMKKKYQTGSEGTEGVGENQKRENYKQRGQGSGAASSWKKVSLKQGPVDLTKGMYVDIFKGKLFNKNFDKKMNPPPSTVLHILPKEYEVIRELVI